jgi:hypothetical protein
VPPRTGTPPPFRAATPPAALPPAPPLSVAPPLPPPPVAPPERFAERSGGRLDDDILGRGTGDVAPRIDPYFKQIFDQFVSMKRSCNEPTAGLVYERFAEKLVKNREDLMLKTGCRDVRFTVYVKDGKAALKATPVKDEA